MFVVMVFLCFRLVLTVYWLGCCISLLVVAWCDWYLRWICLWREFVCFCIVAGLFWLFSCYLRLIGVCCLVDVGCFYDCLVVVSC